MVGGLDVTANGFLSFPCGVMPATANRFSVRAANRRSTRFSQEARWALTNCLPVTRIGLAADDEEAPCGVKSDGREEKQHGIEGMTVAERGVRGVVEEREN